jgi:tetratricopeptide (TPR) repeat protein
MKNRRRLIGLLVAMGVLTLGFALLRANAQRRVQYLRRASETTLRQERARHPNDADVAYYLGLARQKAGDTAEAQQLLETALKETPQDPERWLAVATLAERGGDIPRATEILTEMQQRFPDNAEATEQLAGFALSRKQFPSAYKAAQRATTLAPNRASAWTILGRAAIGADQPAEAKSALERAQQLAPTDWSISLSLGDLALGQKDYPGATKHYRAALLLAPDSPVVWLSLASSLVRSSTLTALEQSEVEQALQKSTILARAVALHPFTEGRLRMHQRRFDEARQAFQRAFSLDTTNPEPLYEESQVARQQGKQKDALGLLKKHRIVTQANQRRSAILTALSQKPDAEKRKALLVELAGVYQALGRLYETSLVLNQLKDYDPDAARQLQALEKDPRLSQQRLAMQTSAQLVNEGNALLQSDKPAEALPYFGTVVNRDPNNAIALQGVGLALHQMGQEGNAVPYFTQATVLNPNLVASQFYLGEIAIRFNLAEEAINRLKQATRLDPKNPEVWYRYHQAHGLVDSHYQEQVEALKQCTQLAPTNVTYQIDLGEVLVDAGSLDEAEVAFRAALKIAPDTVETQSRLGGFLATSRTTPTAWKESNALLSAAAKKDPSHEYTRYSQGVLALKQRQYPQAVTLLQSVAQKNPRSHDIWYQLSRAYSGAGKSAEAATTMQRSRQIQQDLVDFQAAQEKLATDSKNADQRLKVARLCLKNDQPLKAMAHYRILLGHHPNHTVGKREMQELERKLARDKRQSDLNAFEAILNTGGYKESEQKPG